MYLIQSVNFLWLFAMLFFFVLNTGCATVMPGQKLSEQERDGALDILHHTLARQGKCDSFIDSRLTISYDSFFRSGTLSGYLQAQSPSSFRFIGIGPLEQPVLFLNSNGSEFQFIVVPEAKAYIGKTSGKTFTQYSPSGLRADRLCYWFIGGMEPGALNVLRVRKEKQGDGFWFDISNSQEAVLHRILIDPDLKRIVKHILLDSDGKKDVVVDYQWLDFTGCCLPSHMTIETPAHSLKLKLSFSECVDQPDLSRVNFTPAIPPFYKKVSVQ